MRKKFSSEVIDYNTRLCKIVIETDPCKIETLEGRNSLIDLLKQIVNEPSLISYKDILLEKLEITPTNDHWILQARFIENEKKE